MSIDFAASSGLKTPVKIKIIAQPREIRVLSILSKKNITKDHTKIVSATIK